MVGTTDPFITVGPAAVYRQNYFIGQKHKTIIAVGNGSRFIEIDYGLPDVQLFAPFAAYPCVRGFGPSEAWGGGYLWECSGLINVTHEYYVDAPPLLSWVLPTGDGNFILLVAYYHLYYAFQGQVATRNTITSDPQDRIRLDFETNEIGSGPFPLIGDPYSLIQGSDTKIRCFACSSTNIREIGVPVKLQSLLASRPFLKQESRTIYTNYNNFRTPFKLYTVQGTVPVLDANPLGLLLYDPVGIFGQQLSGVTPEVFTGISGISSTWSAAFNGAIMRSFPEGLSWILEDSTDGYYNGYPPNKTPAYYGRWNVPNQRPDSFAPGGYQRDSELMQSLDLSSPVFSQHPNPYVVWDWNEPSYCQTMCAALGFNAADLQP